MEKLELCVTGECKMVSHFGKQLLKMLNKELQYDPEIPLQDIDPRGKNTFIQKLVQECS